MEEGEVVKKPKKLDPGYAWGYGFDEGTLLEHLEELSTDWNWNDKF